MRAMTGDVGPRRWLIGVLLSAALLVTACGDDSGGTGAGEEGGDGPAVVTLGELGLDLPIELPPDLPAPSDGTYVGDSPEAEPWTAVRIATQIDQAVLDEAIRAFAESDPDAGLDESIVQAQTTRDLSDGRYGVYIWTRTIDEQLIVEMGRIESP